MVTGEPEITWQPEFDRARAALERSLLNPAPTAVLQPAGD
jgi:quinolinate synthase